MTLDRIGNGGKEYIWPTFISLLRIYSQPQSFGTKSLVFIIL